MDAEASARPAGLLVRLAALVYEALLLATVLFFATALLLPFTGGRAVAGSPLYQAYLLAVGYAYFGWHWTRTGQTLAMRAWRLRLMDAQGRRVGWARALARYLAAFPSLGLFGLGLVWLLADPRHQAWHDRVSGTWVIREARSREQGVDAQ